MNFKLYSKLHFSSYMQPNPKDNIRIYLKKGIMISKYMGKKSTVDTISTRQNSTHIQKEKKKKHME